MQAGALVAGQRELGVRQPRGDAAQFDVGETVVNPCPIAATAFEPKFAHAAFLGNFLRRLLAAGNGNDGDAFVCREIGDLVAKPFELLHATRIGARGQQHPNERRVRDRRKWMPFENERRAAEIAADDLDAGNAVDEIHRRDQRDDGGGQEVVFPVRMPLDHRRRLFAQHRLVRRAFEMVGGALAFPEILFGLQPRLRNLLADFAQAVLAEVMQDA